MIAMKRCLPIAVMLLFAAALGAQTDGVLGDWHTPAGSTIRIQRCGSSVCLRIAALPPDIPATDIHNPDASLRGRPVCGLVIGNGFTLSDPNHAAGGTVYDPKNGKTYRGGMARDGQELHLRGYVGIPLFGITQTWTRVTPPVKACSGQ